MTTAFSRVLTKLLQRQFDISSGIQSFEVSWISKAAASQRAGRAGRTGPGHCYRIYSSAVYENYFDQHTKPEILRMPIEGIILQMKSMNIDAVANFPFPTPPDRDSLRRAEKTLVHLGALEASESSSKVGGKITELGRSMSLFPLSPRFSKMIVAGQQHGCLPYVIAIVCALSVGDPFIREANLGDGEDDIPDLAGATALTAGEIRHIRDPELRAKEELKVARKAFFDVQKVRRCSPFRRSPALTLAHRAEIPRFGQGNQRRLQDAQRRRGIRVRGRTGLVLRGQLCSNEGELLLVSLFVTGTAG